MLLKRCLVTAPANHINLRQVICRVWVAFAWFWGGGLKTSGGNVARPSGKASPPPSSSSSSFETHHLEEGLLDQAHAGAPYTPYFGVICIAYPNV